MGVEGRAREARKGNKMKLIFILIAGICLFGCNKKVMVVHQEKRFDTSIVVKFSPGALDDTAGSLSGVKKVVMVEQKENPRAVYFDFDQSEIRPGENENLIAWKMAIHGKVVLAGHCDERGSVQYNFGLGQRRAVSVMRWLRENGVRGEIRCVSHGKGGLVQSGCDDDACHQLNRRVEIKMDD